MRISKSNITASRGTQARSKSASQETAHARKLLAFFKSKQGAKKALSVIKRIVKGNDFAKELNWEAALIQKVKPGHKRGVYDVHVAFVALDKNGKETTNYFTAEVDKTGRVLSVPQG